MSQATGDELLRNDAVVRAYLEQHGAEYLAQDATFTDVTTGLSWTGSEAIEGMLDWMYHQVFDAHVEEARVIVGADGTVAVAEMTFVGRHLGEFAGVPATGRDVRMPLVVIYELSRGLIAGARVHLNIASFQAQATA